MAVFSSGSAVTVQVIGEGNDALVGLGEAYELVAVGSAGGGAVSVGVAGDGGCATTDGDAFLGPIVTVVILIGGLGGAACSADAFVF